MRFSEAFVSVDEAAKALGQSRATIRRKVASGELRAVRLGDFGPLRVSVEALEQHLKPIHQKERR